MGARVLAAISIVVLVVAVSTAPVANAMYVGLVVGGGKVSVSFSATVHLTGVSESVFGWFKHLATIYSALKPTIDYNLQQMLQDWLRLNMNLSGATIEHLSTDFSFSEGYKTYTSPVSDMSVDLGNVEGSVERLAEPDGVSVSIESTRYNNSNMVVVYLYFPIKAWHVPTNVKYINITIRGHLSRLLEGANAEASIAVYNYDTGEYDVLRVYALDTDTPTTVSIVVGGARSYALGRTVIVRVRVIDYGKDPITLYLDYAKVDYTYYQADVKVGIAMTISGVSRFSLLEGQIYNLKFRYMAPILRIETPYGITILVNTALFLNWTCFNVPLDQYEVKFNGTHTVFRFRVENLTLPTIGGWRVWIDPEQEIVALGFARVVGYDEIAVYEPWMLGVGAIIALLLVVGVLKAIARAILVVEDVYKSRRRFVVEKP